MSKILSVLIVVIFATASFPVAARDNRLGHGQAASGKETSGQQAANKDAANRQSARTGPGAKSVAAHRGTRGPLFKRRPMFK